MCVHKSSFAYLEVYALPSYLPLGVGGGAVIVIVIFLGQLCPRGKGAVRLIKHQPKRKGQTKILGTTCPTLFDKRMGSLTSPANHVTLKMQETGPYGL